MNQQKSALRQFVNELRSRFQVLVNGDDCSESRKEQLYQSIATLSLVEASLDKSALNAPNLPLQIGVFGPTQVGKSTVTNALLGTNLAEVSPLAGFTVHPQGFARGESSNSDWAEQYFEGYQRTARQSLTRDNFNAFSLEPLDGQGDGEPSVVWDTPDFDSVFARGYLGAVTRVLALADVLLLVVSKDKYADKSVWDALIQLAPLEKPLVVCINKLDEAVVETVVNSFRERYAEIADGGRLQLIPLLYDRSVSEGGALPEAQLEGLQNALQQACSQVDRARENAHLSKVIEVHWNDWCRPIREEQKAEAEWQKQLQSAVDKALASYKKDYLQHPQHYETFQRAIAELLDLLEIPGFAKVLSSTRQVLTWPVRKLFGFGYALRDMATNDTAKERQSVEQRMLHELYGQLITQLSETAIQASQKHPQQRQWWQDLLTLLQQRREALRTEFSASVECYEAQFAPEIHDAAQKMFESLQKQPRLLNSLRAARATADAGGLAVALKTGGIGVTDFILAPAMLSLTSMLTESALGNYVQRVASDLRSKQYSTVKKEIFEADWRHALVVLPRELNRDKHLLIDAHMLSEAEKVRRSLEP